MLQHIALTVNDPEEIENFYEKVLHFSTMYKFSVNGEITRQIFNAVKKADVYVMKYNNVDFEIFISPEKEKKVFSHICLSYQKAETTYNNAMKRGYKVLIKNGENHTTYFIRDKSGNIFEIKEIIKYNQIL